MSNNWSLDNKRNWFLYFEWNLNLNRLNFCFTNFKLDILNAISISRNRHFFNYFIRNSFLNLYFYAFFCSYGLFNYLLNFHCLDIFLFHNHYSVHKDFNRDLNLLNDDLRDRNLNNLKYRLVTYNNPLDDFRNLYDLFNNSWNNYYLLNNSLYFDNPWHFYNSLNNSINILRLDSYDFFLNDNRHRFFNIYRFYDLLFSGDYLNCLDLYFFDFFSDVRYMNLRIHWNLFGYIQWDYFLNLDIFRCENFLNNWFVNKNFYLSNNFLFVSFNEMRSFNENFFGNFSDNLFFNFKLNWN